MEGTTMKSVSELIQNANKSDQDEYYSTKKIYLRQWVMWLNSVLLQIILGMVDGYSSIVLQQLKTPKIYENNDMKFENGEIFGKPHLIVDSLDVQSWIASSMIIFQVPGCWVLAIWGSKFGRKQILLISVAGFAISWIIIAFANDVNYIIVGRSLSGVAVGVSNGLSYMYLVECAIPQLRSIFYALFNVSFVLGTGLSHLVGTLYHWRTTALFSAGFGIIALFATYYLPESPVWLVHKNKFENALESWLFLRGKTELKEFELLCFNNDREPISNVNESRQTTFYSSTFWKPLIIVLMLFTTSQMSGMGAISSYCTPMIEEITGSTNAYIPTLIIDALNLVASVIMCFLSTKFSTRTQMIFSGLSASLCLFALALSIRFDIYTPWSQITCLSLHGISISMGLGPLPWTFCSELFTVNHKDVGVGIASNYVCILAFMIVKFNPYLFSIFEPWRTFLIYASLTLISSIILYFILPNTKNKSLKEIELLFSKNSNS